MLQVFLDGCCKTRSKCCLCCNGCTHVASVFFKCFIYLFGHMLASMFYLDVVCILSGCCIYFAMAFSSVFQVFLQVFYTYVVSVSTILFGYFKSRSGVAIWPVYCSCWRRREGFGGVQTPHGVRQYVECRCGNRVRMRGQLGQATSSTLARRGQLQRRWPPQLAMAIWLKTHLHGWDRIGGNKVYLLLDWSWGLLVVLLTRYTSNKTLTPCSFVGFSQSLSANQQCFPLTTNQHQPDLSAQKSTSEQALK